MNREQTTEKTLPPQNVREVRAKVRFGVVRVNAGGSDAIEVKGVRRVESASDETADRLLGECRLDIRFEGDVVVVEDHVPPVEGFLLRPGGVRLELTLGLPAGLSADVSLGAGDAELTGDFADATAKVGAGNLRLTGGRTTGDVRLKTGAGDVRVDGVACAGPTLSARTGAGNVSVGVTSLPRQGLDAKAGAGNVTVAIPFDAPATVSLKTGIGNASSDFEAVKSEGGGLLSRNMSGSVNGGGPAVTLKTGVGNVELKRRP